MRTLQNVSYDFALDLAATTRAHVLANGNTPIPHDAARTILDRHFGARTVTHVVQRLTTAGIVAPLVKPPKATPVTPEATPAPSATPKPVTPALVTVDDAQPEPVITQADLDATLAAPGGE